MTPKQQLEHWEALAAKATPGPWLNMKDGFILSSKPSSDGVAIILDDEYESCLPDNLAFIAASREAVEVLGAALRDSWKEVEHWKAKYLEARSSGYQEGIENVQNPPVGSCGHSNPKNSGPCDSCLLREAVDVVEKVIGAIDNSYVGAEVTEATNSARAFLAKFEGNLPFIMEPFKCPKCGTDGNCAGPGEDDAGLCHCPNCDHDWSWEIK